jgi:hypothetical protein
VPIWWVVRNVVVVTVAALQKFLRLKYKISGKPRNAMADADMAGH